MRDEISEQSKMYASKTITAEEVYKMCDNDIALEHIDNFIGDKLLVLTDELYIFICANKDLTDKGVNVILKDDLKVFLRIHSHTGTWYSDDYVPYCGQRDVKCSGPRMIRTDYGNKCPECKNEIGLSGLRLTDSPLNNALRIKDAVGFKDISDGASLDELRKRQSIGRINRQISASGVTSKFEATGLYGSFNNEITIDPDEILKLPDFSITDTETIRQIALWSIKNNSNILNNKIKSEMEFAGLYPHVMKSFDIQPDNVPTNPVFETLSLKGVDKNVRPMSLEELKDNPEIIDLVKKLGIDMDNVGIFDGKKKFKQTIYIPPSDGSIDETLKILPTISDDLPVKIVTAGLYGTTGKPGKFIADIETDSINFELHTEQSFPIINANNLAKSVDNEIVEKMFENYNLNEFPKIESLQNPPKVIIDSVPTKGNEEFKKIWEQSAKENDPWIKLETFLNKPGLEHVKTFRIDTRDFATVDNSDHKKFVEKFTPHLQNIVRKYPNRFDYNLQEIKTILSNAKITSGGEKEWRMLHYKNNKETMGWELKYLQIIKITDNKYVILNSEDNLIRKSIWSDVHDPELL